MNGICCSWSKELSEVFLPRVHRAEYLWLVAVSRGSIIKIINYVISDRHSKVVTRTFPDSVSNYLEKKKAS